MAASPIELLTELVEIPSHVTQPRGIREVSDRIGSALDDLGFQQLEPERATRRAPLWAEHVLSAGVAFENLLDPVVWHRAGGLPETVLVLGDLDGALAIDAPRLVIRGGRAIGPAAADMKGGLVVLLEALRSLDLASLPAITIVLSCDEQAGSLRSAPTIEKYAATASACICLECARDGGKLMRSRAHIGVGLLTATGTEAHAGSALDQGVNAINSLARGIAALTEIAADDATVTATMLAGGRRRSLVPGNATAVLDVRSRDASAWAALERQMQSALARVDGTLRLDLFNHRPGLPSTKLTSEFLSIVKQAGRKIGIDVEAIDSMAAGSTAFVDSSTTPVLDGMGPIGGALMTTDEYVEIESLTTRSALLAETLKLLGRKWLERDEVRGRLDASER